MSRPPVLLRGVDRSALAVALSTRLRQRGVAVDFTAMESFVRAISAALPTDRDRLYWTARVSLVRRHSELAAFDAVFDAVFADAMLAPDPLARRMSGATAEAPSERAQPRPGDTADEGGTGLPWMTRPTVVAAAEDTDSALGIPERLPGELEALADVPFEQLGAQEMVQLGRWLEAAARTWPARRSRRARVDPGGRRVALRPTLARARHTGWEAVDLVCTKPVLRPRRVVMLCDVSQSMQAQAVAYFHLMRGLALRADAAEVFAFSTSLTRLTAALAHRSAEAAVDEAGRRVVDRFGGTRIATNVQALLSSHHGGALRGAVVIIGSDGWDSDPPEQLDRAMARLRRRAHRVIWMNPRASAPGFEPRVAAMAAALPYCDALLPADTFAALAAVIAEIGRPSRMPVSSRASRGWTAGTARP